MILQVLPPAQKIRSSFAFLAMVVIRCPLASPWSFPFGRFVFVGENNLFSSNFAGVPGVHDAVSPAFDFRMEKRLDVFVWCCPFWTHPSTTPPVKQQKNIGQKKQKKISAIFHPPCPPGIVSVGCYAMLVCRVVGGLCRVVVGDTQVKSLQNGAFEDGSGGICCRLPGWNIKL